jgi:hypothetical protein
MEDLQERLGLKPREWQTLNAAAWARGVVPNGHYLCSTAQVAPARRMIARGFLTEIPHKKAGLICTSNPDKWLVVKYSNKNVAAVKKATRK